MLSKLFLNTVIMYTFNVQGSKNFVLRVIEFHMLGILNGSYNQKLTTIK